MNAGRAVALMLSAEARRAPRPVVEPPLVALSTDRARRLALALAAPVVEVAPPRRRRARLAAAPALEPTVPA